MTSAERTAESFIVEAFDREWWCPVLQARFQVSNTRQLRDVLGAQADDDPELQRAYTVSAAELEAMTASFAIEFDPTPLRSNELEFNVYRESARSIPYLVHTGYELPLLLEGSKKLAKMYGPYPPMTFEGEERFNYCVAEGILHREEFLEPFDRPTNRYQGHRTVYYTLKGEEWRIPAMQLIWRASEKAGWSQYFERLEGMLFGYADWQNDWWIEAGLERGGIGGARVCCAVTAAGLAWLQAAGFRALPPCDKPHLLIAAYDDTDAEMLRTFLREETDSVGLVCFTVPLWRVRELLKPLPEAGRWLVASDRITELNRHLQDAIIVATRRDA
jgi:hypothetical protein